MWNLQSPKGLVRVVACAGMAFSGATAHGLSANAAADADLNAIRVVPEVLDLGSAASGELGRGSVWLINTGESAATLERARKTCGCLEVDFAGTTLGPGQAFEVTVSMKAPKHAGQQARKAVRFPVAGGQLAEAVVQLEAVHPRVAVVQEYLEVRRKDRRDATRFFAPESRLWFDEKVGPGTLRGDDGSGPWSGWDQELRSTSRYTNFEMVQDAVRVTAVETNQFFALLDAIANPYYLTYYFDENDKISGMLVSSIPGRESAPNRRDEFQQWLAQTHPRDFDAIMPEGSLQPSADNARRVRTLLLEWRKERGLPKVDLSLSVF